MKRCSNDDCRKLRRGVHLITSDNPGDWEGYGGRPLWFAVTPSSLLSPELALSITIQFDYEIENQTDEGNWQPHCSWGQYEDDWVLCEGRVGWVSNPQESFDVESLRSSLGFPENPCALHFAWGIRI